jgi:hypothetical protein
VISGQGDTSPSQETSAPERHLCPQAMQKKAIKPNPQLNAPQIKFFQPLLLESVCAFILRAGSRTLST